MPFVAIVVGDVDVYPDQFDHWHRRLVEFTFSPEGLEEHLTRWSQPIHMLF